MGGAARTMAPTASATTVTVGRGDTAWSLATEHLGDGARWREIWEANREQPSPTAAGGPTTTSRCRRGGC